MSLLLLDTTFLVHAERGGPDLDEAMDDEDGVGIAAVTVAELLVWCTTRLPKATPEPYRLRK
jgi:predicted nucleic acid-binding protein